MNTERLTKLRDLLLTVPAERFNMNYWGQYEDRDSAPDTLNIAECGTAACAFGWACSIPEFREAGLTLFKIHTDWMASYAPRFTTRSLTVPMGMVTYTGYSAAEKFFDIWGDEAEYLFNPSTYAPNDEDEEWDCESITPAEVVERIDRLLAGKRIDHAD